MYRGLLYVKNDKKLLNTIKNTKSLETKTSDYKNEDEKFNKQILDVISNNLFNKN